MTTVFLTTVLILIIIHSSNTVKAKNWIHHFTYNAYLNELETFQLFWNHVDNETIEFGMAVNTNGWIGFGISLSGQMSNSDIFVGWVDDNNGSVYLQDRYTSSERIEPFYDLNQSLTLLNGSQIDGITRIRFTRPTILCNKEDHSIIPGTTRLIYAYSMDDSDDFQFHGAIHRGVRSLNLYSDYYTLNNNISDINATEYKHYFDLRVNNTNSITNETNSLYYCKLLKIPLFDSIQHAIRYDLLTQPGNEGVVHHIALYNCPSYRVTSQSHVNTEGVCDEWDENMPSKYCRNGQMLHGFGVGTNNFTYPVHVGYEIGADSTVNYLLMEMHYENTYLLNNVSDTSGVRIWYTPQIRKYSAGNIMFGLNPTIPNYHLIPHGVSRVVNTAYCLPKCMQNGIPAKGVKAFAVLLHQHYLGAVLKLRIVRNGTELKPILEDYAYDFNYQQTVKIDERDIFPTDTLILECHYNTLHINNSNVTFGGESTQDEMCLAQIVVYPAIPLAVCLSDFTYDDFVHWTEISVKQGFLKHFDKGPRNWNYYIGNNNSFEWYNMLWDETYQRQMICLDQNSTSVLSNVSDPYDYIPEYYGFESYKEDQCWKQYLFNDVETIKSNFVSTDSTVNHNHICSIALMLFMFGYIYHC
eukprot:64410_1